jgi:hypothetical protein
MGRLSIGPDRGRIASRPVASPSEPIPIGPLDFNPQGVASIDTDRTSPAVALPLTARCFPKGKDASLPTGDAKRTRQSSATGRTGD